MLARASSPGRSFNHPDPVLSSCTSCAYRRVCNRASGRFPLQTLFYKLHIGSFNHHKQDSTSYNMYGAQKCIPRVRRNGNIRRSASSFNALPFFQLRRPGELVDRRSPPPVLVPGLTLVFERRVRSIAGPLLNSHRCWPSAPPWAPIYRCPHSLAASEAFAVQTLCVGLNLVDPPLSALAALPESLLHDRP